METIGLRGPRVSSKLWLIQPYLEGIFGFGDGEEEERREGCKIFLKRRIENREFSGCMGLRRILYQVRGQDVEGVCLPARRIGADTTFSGVWPPSRHAYFLNSNLCLLIYLFLFFCNFSTCLPTVCHSLRSNWNRTSTVYIVSTLSFLWNSQCQTCLSTEEDWKASLREITMTDQLHGCSLAFLRRGSAMVVGHTIPQFI